MRLFLLMVVALDDTRAGRMLVATFSNDCLEIKGGRLLSAAALVCIGPRRRVQLLS
jgi:hypothetical protein